MSALKICPQCGTEYELDQRFCPKDGSTLKLQGGQTGDLVGHIVADRYSVLKKLGEGGMGTVYLAEHVKMGRKSALKVMNPGMVHDADAISRFNREAANASRINHPNVAAVYDFGETSEGLIYLAMEFVEGPALTSVIKEAGSLPPKRAADITRQASEALAVAHDMGIVHRDLKPDNIMLAKNRDGSDLVKVVDFGIAKAANNEAQKVTKTGLVVGTPEYMSPEQLAGDKLDGRSDTYSLALVTFAMMTGKLPFPGETVQESMIARLTDEPKRLAEMKANVVWPAEVQAVMDKALARDAAERYQSANEFGRDLWKSVEKIRESTATTAFTAVMQPGQVPAPAKTQIEGVASKPVPPTRVNPATPATGTPVSAPPTRNKTPLVAGLIAAAVIAVAGGGYLVMKGSSAKTAAAPQGDTQNVTQLKRDVPVAAINLPRELERIRPLVDSTPLVASGALTQLKTLDSLAQSPTTPDSTFLYYRYLRSRGLISAGETRAGCDSLFAIQGRIEKSPTLQRAGGVLLAACRSS